MRTKGLLIASAAAALVLGGAVAARAENAEGGDAKIHCAGVNACKGQGTCAGAGNTCAGQNECKGKGVLDMTEKECKAKGGKVVDSH